MFVVLVSRAIAEELLRYVRFVTNPVNAEPIARHIQTPASGRKHTLITTGSPFDGRFHLEPQRFPDTLRRELPIARREYRIPFRPEPALA